MNVCILWVGEKIFEVYKYFEKAVEVKEKLEKMVDTEKYFIEIINVNMDKKEI